MRRVIAWAAGTVALLVLVAGGYLMSIAHSEPWPDPPTSDPAALVGAWWVDGPEVFDDRLLVLLPSGEARVFGDDDCLLIGSWAATTSGLASTSLTVVGGPCRKDLDAAYDVSGAIARFSVSGDLIMLSNSAGTVALLRPAERGVWPDSARSEVGLVEALAEPYSGRPDSPLPPPDLTVPDADQLVGVRWLPMETVGSTRWPDRTRPHAIFDAGGRWSGADGCNQQGGIWSMDSETGEWLASTDGQTEIFCDNVDVASVVAQARAVRLDGEELVLFDADSAELGRLVREAP